MSDSPPSPIPGAGLKTVLLIDDDVRLRPLLVEGLEAHGYHTLSAPNSELGGELARAHLPDVIVCDIDMPGVDGREFLKQLRLDPKLADRHFILITGDPAYANPGADLEIGADDFLLKPFSIGDLTHAVAARLQRAEISRHLENRAIAQLRAGLHGTLPPEFFTPLASVFGLTGVLAEKLDQLGKDEIRSILHDILTSARQLHRTLRNHLHILELDAPNRPPPNWLEAHQVAEAFTAGVNAAAERHQRQADITLELTGVRLHCGVAEFTALAEELVDNALNFSRKDSPVRVRFKPEGSRLHITVQDEGRGMTPQQLLQLGLGPQHERKKIEQSGPGLGLALARRIVYRLNGRLTIDSEPGRGTTVDVTVPI